jgi:hypothetical protein
MLDLVAFFFNFGILTSSSHCAMAVALELRRRAIALIFVVSPLRHYFLESCVA